MQKGGVINFIKSFSKISKNYISLQPLFKVSVDRVGEKGQICRGRSSRSKAMLAIRKQIFDNWCNFCSYNFFKQFRNQKNFWNINFDLYLQKYCYRSTYEINYVLRSIFRICNADFQGTSNIYEGWSKIYWPNIFLVLPDAIWNFHWKVCQFLAKRYSECNSIFWWRKSLTKHYLISRGW